MEGRTASCSKLSDPSVLFETVLFETLVPVKSSLLDVRYSVVPLGTSSLLDEELLVA